MEKQNRINWIDVAKGICMLSVIVGHMGWKKADEIVYAYHLTVFFILTGYTLKKDYNSKQILKRFRNLMVPYAWTCIAVMIMDILNLIIIQKQFELSLFAQVAYRDFLRSLFASGSRTTFGTIDIGGRIGAIWYLPATFFAIVLSLFLLEYIHDKRCRWLCAFVLSALAYLSAKHLWFPFSIQSGCFAIPLVLLGYEAKTQNLIDRIKLPHFIFCLLIFLFGIQAGKAKIFYVTANMDSIFLSPVFGLASSACVLYIAKKLKNCRILSWIGRNSLFFLCVHLFEIETLSIWFLKIQSITGTMNNKLFLLVLKLVFITVSVAFLNWFRNQINHPHGRHDRFRGCRC